ncbi:NADPH-dependent FMN reductase [Consotaella aegiceratis]|uniref:NADPH-dependent FMN reductase n=1 Tax=Consotaella aegiceratis TaxID=3097961 RepID=UPI002F41C138
MSARILVLPGSNRLDSNSRKLAAEAARLLSLTEATITFVNLSDYPLPIYDGDLDEHGTLPENAALLAHRIAAQDGLLVVSPEYNASMPALLKNVLDWVSRVRKVHGRPVQPFARLVVGLASTSSGPYGGMRALAALRPVMMTLGAEVLTTQCMVANAREGFDDAGRLVDDGARMALDGLIASLLDHTRAVGRHD